MLEELRDERLIDKVGGRFKLSALIQKRLVYLNRGARSFVESDKKNKLQVVLQEILEDKIYLDTAGNLCERDTATGLGSPLDFDFTDSSM